MTAPSDRRDAASTSAPPPPAATELSRKDFGLTWNVALEAGGVLVGDKAKVALEISAIKQA